MKFPLCDTRTRQIFVFLDFFLGASKVTSSDAADKPRNSDHSQTLHSACKRCERAKAFNNAACVSGAGGDVVARVQPGAPLLSTSIFHFISMERFGEHNTLVSCNQTQIDLFFRQTQTKWLRAQTGTEPADFDGGIGEIKCVSNA